MKKCFLFLSVSVFMVAGCSTTSNHRPSYKSSEVIERVGGRSDTPAWATGEKTMWEEDSKVIFVSVQTMDGDNRPEACMSVAGELGRSALMRYIKDAITSSGQVSQISSKDDPAYESLIAFLSQGKLHGVGVKTQYWDKREVSEVSGSRTLKLYCAAQLTISQTELERQLREATVKTPQGNPEIRQQLLTAQKEFISGMGKKDSEN